MVYTGGMYFFLNGFRLIFLLNCILKMEKKLNSTQQCIYASAAQGQGKAKAPAYMLNRCSQLKYESF
jgi:hypothetical protein